MSSFTLTRSRLLRLGAALSLYAASPLRAFAQNPGAVRMNTRPIPSTHEALPVIGCGTWIGFDVAAGSAEYQRLPGVLDALFAAGGKVIDSSPMYGRAEAVTGDLLAAANQRPKAFLATKVWTSGRDAGIAQMEQSFARLRTDRIDLMQVHNLVDWRTHLKTLRGWKDKGRVRYIGITHYTASAYAEVEAALRAEKLDFLQINYSFDEREAAQHLLPLAAERGVAVIVNLPFGGGGLLRRLRDKPLPAWAGEIGCTSWAQVLIKFVLSHPAVTCTIPGTSRAEHMADNAAAGAGALPDAAFWRRKDVSLPG
ncbi:aldo/keto reductase [Variovorax sp. GT1P44]|uniref:aldo/keto reductase n=1 Tax=Variovorax sp. GT1P44 TaxID=3443742 RepID=UPI003F474296